MNPFSPDKRLKLIASMVKSGKTVADIGCDHAVLPVFLVSNNICPTALACDLREGPLSVAKKNIDVAGLSEKIETRLCDGLDDVLADDTDEIVMAGMGGLLICDIISRAPWLKSADKGLVMQPMTHAHELRRYLCENGFSIVAERAASDSGHYYTVIRAEYTGKKMSPDLFFCHTGLLTVNPGVDEFAYIEKEASRIKKRVNGLEASAVPFEINKKEIDDLKNLYIKLSAVKISDEK